MIDIGIMPTPVRILESRKLRLENWIQGKLQESSDLQKESQEVLSDLESYYAGIRELENAIKKLGS